MGGHIQCQQHSQQWHTVLNLQSLYYRFQIDIETDVVTTTETKDYQAENRTALQSLNSPCAVPTAECSCRVALNVANSPSSLDSR
jgi:hypothetical protein